MLASSSGPSNLEEVENMTKRGHGLFALSARNGRFADLLVGVLASGFLNSWLRFLGYDTSGFPGRRPRSMEEVESLHPGMYCTLLDLFASMPEIDDLFVEVFGGSPRWITVAYDINLNHAKSRREQTGKKAESSYVRLVDRSGQVSTETLDSAGWPLTEIHKADRSAGTGNVFHARVDHAGHDYWHQVLPLHSSPFRSGLALLFPTLGTIREYRAIAVATLYALSIMVRYMPSAWRRVEGGNEDQYLALVETSLTVWERLLPELFLQSITGERVRTAQPGSLFA